MEFIALILHIRRYMFCYKVSSTLNLELRAYHSVQFLWSPNNIEVCYHSDVIVSANHETKYFFGRI